MPSSHLKSCSTSLKIGEMEIKSQVTVKYHLTPNRLSSLAMTSTAKDVEWGGYCDTVNGCVTGTANNYSKM